MRDQEKLRFFLQKNYYIEKDYIVEIKNIFYTFIRAVKGKDSLNKEELILGKSSFLDSPLDFRKYLDYNINRYKNYRDYAQDKNSIQNLGDKVEFFIKIKEKYYGKNA